PVAKPPSDQTAKHPTLEPFDVDVPGSIDIPIDSPMDVEPPHDTMLATQVRGRLVLSVLRFVARRFGERALRELLTTLPEQARRPFELGIAEEMWVDGFALRTLVDAIDAKLGSDDLHTIVECGGAAA